MAGSEYEMNSVDAVMQIFMLIVYADGTRHRHEIAEMMRRIEKLKLFTENGFFPNARGLVALLEKHDACMRSRLEGSGVLDVAHSAIQNIDNPELISQLLPAMNVIANADSEFHEMEKQLVTLAIDAWGEELWPKETNSHRKVHE